MLEKHWEPGDWAIYRKTKQSTTPGRRAAHVKASEKGDSYTYLVDKFWVVESTLPGDRLLLRTARGKSHVIQTNDPNLRRPGWITRLLWRSRFRNVEMNCDQSPHFAS